jgi:thiamine biosynthesis lipoprotein
MQRHRFRAMGTWVECLVEARPTRPVRAALENVQGEFERLERMLSRFRPDSELSRLNRDRALDHASPELVELTELALDAREHTGGRFDPTLHDALVAAGYDRTFEELSDDGSPSPIGKGGGGVTVGGRRIELGPGASLDLGGIAKGWTADRCARELGSLGPALVNAGGDLSVTGPCASGAWPVAVDLPNGTLTLALTGGGLATSGRDKRSWRRGGELRHHLIDPATRRPARGAPRSVTVAASSATAAEVSAKALFLAGPDAEREAERTRTPAVIVGDDGDARLVGGLR